MANSENNHYRGKGASTGLDYRCFENYKALNMFEEDDKSNKAKGSKENDCSKPL